MQGLDLFQMLFKDEKFRLSFLISLLLSLFISFFIMFVILKYSYDDKNRHLARERTKHSLIHK